MCAWCVWRKACPQYVWRSEDNFVLSFYISMGSETQTQAPGLHNKPLYLWSHQAGAPPCAFSAAWIYVFLGHQCDNVCCESLSKVVSWAEYTGKHFPRSRFYTWEFLAWELSWIYAGIEPGLWSQWPAFITRWKVSSPASCLSERHFHLERTLRLLLFLLGELRPRESWRLNNRSLGCLRKTPAVADLELSSWFILHLEFAPWPFSLFLRWLSASVFFFFKCLGEGLPLFLGLLSLFASEKLVLKKKVKNAKTDEINKQLLL